MIDQLYNGLEDNDVKLYSIDNEGKSFMVVARFIRILKNKVYKCMISVSKNVYIDKLNGLVYK